MSYSIIRPADHAGWLAERAKGIGSSEVGTIFGVNSFDSPLKLWRRKVGLDGPVEETEAMTLGHAFEDGVAREFARKTGAIIDESSAIDWLAVDDEHPWRRVSPDRMFWKKGTPPEERTLANATMLECKTTSHNVSDENIPDYWFCQVQYQMGVLGLKSCCLAWVTAFGGRFHHDYCEIPFNQGFFDTLMAKVDTFWNVNILGHVEPEDVLTLSDATLKWRATKDRRAVADEQTLGAIKDFLCLKAESERLKELKDEMELRIKNAMRNADTLVDSSDRILATWREFKGRDSFDTETFKEENPEIYSRYIKSGSPSRRFCIKAPKAS